MAEARRRELHAPAERFGEWLDGEMTRRKLTATALARKTGAFPGAVRRWRNGGARPRRDQVEAIAAALGVETATALRAAGYPPDATTDATTPAEAFGRWLGEEMDVRGWNLSDLARRVGVMHSTISKWLHGTYRPRPAQCALLADALGLSVDDVLVHAGHRPGERDAVVVGDVRREIVALVDQIPETLLSPLVPMLRGLASEPVQRAEEDRLRELLNL